VTAGIDLTKREAYREERRKRSRMATAQVQELIMKELRATGAELFLSDLVARLRPNVPSGRNEVKAAVVPLLYRRDVELTPSRKFRIGS
jgi:hypothetical protein